VPLDLETLGVVRQEVARRAADCRRQWRLEPDGSGLVAARELEALDAWLAAQADARLDERWSLTEGGVAALMELESQSQPATVVEPLTWRESAEQLPLTADAGEWRYCLDLDDVRCAGCGGPVEAGAFVLRHGDVRLHEACAEAGR
jgi:hypothetical protein